MQNGGKEELCVEHWTQTFILKNFECQIYSVDLISETTQLFSERIGKFSTV